MTIGSVHNATGISNMLLNVDFQSAYGKIVITSNYLFILVSVVVSATTTAPTTEGK